MIQAPQVVCEIIVNKNPPPSSFCAGNNTLLRARSNFLGVHVEKVGGFLQREGFHH
jgi:hypothetical protein